MILDKRSKSLIKGFLIPFRPRQGSMSSVMNWGRFIREARKYEALGGAISTFTPILSDYKTSAGEMSGAYFHHDLLVAKFIHKNQPRLHVDVGSRIDGFVAHVASFRKITIFDIRSFDRIDHEEIEVVQVDFMNSEMIPHNYADSVSCLNTLEHFGLGRYSDTLNPEGHIIGFNNLLKMLETDGTLYIAIPISRRPKTHFNAHRIFSPEDVLTWPTPPESIELLRFDYVDQSGRLYQDVALSTIPGDDDMGFGIYTFRKKS